MALQALSRARYNGKEYFWVNDMHPRVVMHPIRPELDGKDVTGDQTLSFLVANIAPGTRIPIELYREGQRRTVTVTVGKRPSEEELAQSQMFNSDPQEGGDQPAPGGQSGEALAQSLGLQVSPLTPRFAQQLGVSPDSGGLVILAQTIIADVVPPKERGHYQVYIAGVFAGQVGGGRLWLSFREQAGRQHQQHPEL